MHPNKTGFFASKGWCSLCVRHYLIHHGMPGKCLRNLCGPDGSGGGAEIIGFSKTHNPEILPWPRLETLTSVKQYSTFVSRSGRNFTMVMCISALLEGNEVCLFLQLIYRPHIPVVRIFNKFSQNSRGCLENTVLRITDPSSARDSISQRPAVGPSFLPFIHLSQKHFSVCSLQQSPRCPRRWGHSRGQDRHYCSPSGAYTPVRGVIAQVSDTQEWRREQGGQLGAVGAHGRTAGCRQGCQGRDR